jgi:hypothetical protein
MFRRLCRFFRLSFSTAKETHLPEQRSGSVCSQAEKEALMNQMDYKGALDMVRRAGFSTADIERLARLHRAYAHNEQDQAPVDQRRLEFVRWLVETGRLTDYMA